MAMMGDGSYGSGRAVDGVAWAGREKEKEIGFWEVLGLFSDVVLVTLFVFLEICVSEKVCRNLCNVI